MHHFGLGAKHCAEAAFGPHWRPPFRTAADNAAAAGPSDQSGAGACGTDDSLLTSRSATGYHDFDEGPRLLVATRFGLGIQDRRWFDHRLHLIEAITAASLASQTRQDFTWAIFVDSSLDQNVRAKLHQITSAVKHSVIVDYLPHNTDSVLALTEHLGLSQDGYVLTARIDDDDAWHRETVEKVSMLSSHWMQKHRDEGLPGMAMTFAEGLEWLMYDLIDVDKRAKGEQVVRLQAIRAFSHPFHSMSVFVLADQASRVAAISGKHTAIADSLAQRGFEICVADDPEMWLYVRHKQVVSALQKAKGDSKPVEVSQLESRFGISAKLVEKYIHASGDHGYALEKRTVARRTSLKRDLKLLGKRLADQGLESAERNTLLQQREEVIEELNRIAAHVVGDI